MRLKTLAMLRSRSSGFTLVELLIYVSVASVVLAASAYTVLSSIRSSTNLELERRGIETWARITQFIESEIAEGAEILYGERYVQCEDSMEVQRSTTADEVVFSIAIPVPANTKWQSDNTSVFDKDNNRLLVHYALRPENGYFALLRCGPPYDEQTGERTGGELKADADRAYETMIHPRAELNLLTTNLNRVTYTLNFLNPAATGGGAEKLFNESRRATATTGQQLIDDRD